MPDAVIGKKNYRLHSILQPYLEKVYYTKLKKRKIGNIISCHFEYGLTTLSLFHDNREISVLKEMEIKPWTCSTIGRFRNTNRFTDLIETVEVIPAGRALQHV